MSIQNLIKQQIKGMKFIVRIIAGFQNWPGCLYDVIIKSLPEIIFETFDIRKRGWSSLLLLPQSGWVTSWFKLYVRQKFSKAWESISSGCNKLQFMSPNIKIFVIKFTWTPLWISSCLTNLHFVVQQTDCITWLIERAPAGLWSTCVCWSSHWHAMVRRDDRKKLPGKQ